MSEEKLSKLEKVLLLVSGAIPMTEFLFYRNSAPNTPGTRIAKIVDPLINHPYITPHLGNYPESFFIPAVSGLVGDFIERLGDVNNNPLLTKLGKYFSEITTLGIVSYGTLGETILPEILRGTADPKDVPAVLVSALAGYTIAKISKNKGVNYNFYEKIKEAALVKA